MKPNNKYRREYKVILESESIEDLLDVQEQFLGNIKIIQKKQDKDHKYNNRPEKYVNISWLRYPIRDKCHK